MLREADKFVKKLLAVAPDAADDRRMAKRASRLPAHRNVSRIEAPFRDRIFWFISFRKKKLVLIPMKAATDSDLIPVTRSDVMPVTLGAKRRWRPYRA